MKIVAMIPARMGSKRVKAKNLRLIKGRPLIDFVLQTISKLDVFNEVYINSEDVVFENIAKKYGFKFYKRDEKLSSDTSTNDEFAYDFLKNVSCDVLIQVLPTSPFLSLQDINEFTKRICKDDIETLISVEHKQIACVYKGQALNFEVSKKNPPSQDMEPIKVYATALMGWKASTYLKNYEKYGVAYHGAESRKDFFELRGISCIDIDREEDFLLAEAIIAGRNESANSNPVYYQQSNSWQETDVLSILAKDGVKNNDLFDVNNEITNLKNILELMPKTESWSKRLVDTESNSMTVIAQMPGEGNRRHYHPDWNEWWYIIKGEWLWDIEGSEKKVVAGDVVFMEKNRKHKITAIGNSQAVRMAVSRSDVAHIYDD